MWVRSDSGFRSLNVQIDISVKVSVEVDLDLEGDLADHITKLVDLPAKVSCHLGILC